MTDRKRLARERKARPIVDVLEPRALLSQMTMPSAEIMTDSARTKPVPIVSQLTTTNETTVSTVPGNGDVNPYGVAFVPWGFPSGGATRAGDVLVSNFNSSSNLQGTGSTIDSIAPNGSQSLFFQGQPGLGLNTALGVLKSGFVIVGSLPTTDGTSATIQQGSLLILNRSGNVVQTLSSPSLLNGPWDLTVNDRGNTAQVFVSNTLSGTVTRINLQVVHHGRSIAVTDMTQIASGFSQRADPAALWVGPTGLAFDPSHNILYVASTEDNAIYAIRNASTTRHDEGVGRVVYSDSTHLHGPLGLLLAPNGDLITANGDAINADPNQPSEIVEFTPRGQFVSQFQLDANPAGPFGIALSNGGRHSVFAAGDDDQNVLDLFPVQG